MKVNKQVSYPKKQQGVVIVVALFIVALVATMAYLMMERLQRDTSRTSLILRYVQAEAYSQGSIAWAMDALSNDWLQQREGQVIDRMPMISPVNNVNEFQINSSIEDMQGRFNINNLKSEDAQKDFSHLLITVMPSLKSDDVQPLILAIVDWITPARSQNEYSKYYQSLPHPYRAAHRPMITPTELLQVKGMTPQLYAAIAPYVTALPEPTLINVLTAPAPVLATLAPAITLQNATAMAAVVASAQPASVEAFRALDVVSNLDVSASKVTVSSSYFLVKTDVAIEKQHFLIYTLLQRDSTPGKARISIKWQSIGTW